MHRNYLSIAAAAACAGLMACAQTPVAPAADPMDALIVKSASEVTNALRELSEVTGNSRVITATAPAPERQATPEKAKRPTATTIAARASTLPVAADDGEAAEAPAPAPAAQRDQAIRAAAPAQAAPAEPAAARAPLPSSSTVAVGANLTKVPAGLEILISTGVWTGDIEELLTQIAKETGWKVGLSTGLKVAPVRISVNATNRSAFELLQDVGAIANGSATIVVSEASRTLSVRYPQR